MSAGYATKLSYRDDLGGQLGDPELQDTPEDVVAKVATLADLVRPGYRCVWNTSHHVPASSHH